MGRWAERFLRPSLRGGVSPSAFLPTERALGVAVEDLFQSLPSPYRSQLDELPRVVRRLEEHARDTRARIAKIDAGASAADASSLPSFRERLRQELVGSVSALESIRLELLRLANGEDDLRATTGALSAARGIVNDLRHLQEAQSEVERAINPLDLDLRPHTPV